MRIREETGKTILFVTHDIDEAVYLADEVVSISGRPGMLTARVPITAPRPRRRGAPEFADIAAKLRDELAETAYPRPTNGIMFAITVMNSTLVSSGRLAM